MSVSYAKSFTDNRGCIHSIDNLVFDYLCKLSSTDVVFTSLTPIFEKHIPDWNIEKYSKKDMPACATYSWFSSSIWGGGVYIQYGQYKDYDAVSKEWYILPVIRFKVNPNKYYCSALFLDMLNWISSFCDNGALVKFDYAVDVPAPIANISVNSRKEFGVYKGTIYYGQRGKHGRLKIYDKTKESNLDSSLTRIEYTFAYGKPIVFDNVCWLTNGPLPLPDSSTLGKTAWTYAYMLMEIQNCGGDVHKCLSLLDRRTKTKIEPYVVGVGIQLYSATTDCLVRLLSDYCLDLSISFVSDGVNKVSIGSNSLVPLSVDDDEDLPF